MAERTTGQKCFVKICETKSVNFLIFQPIFIRFSLLCLEISFFWDLVKPVVEFLFKDEKRANDNSKM